MPDDLGQPTNRPIYQDENGTDHIFYPTLHDGDAEDAPVSGVSDVEYTRDGSYLRLKVYTAGYKEIEFRMARCAGSTPRPACRPSSATASTMH